MELRHLRYFVAVADEGTTVHAAARLRVAQQTLWRQLQDLERELGVALFVRHPRGMALTPAGREFLAHARRILAESARAVEHVRRVGRDGVRLRAAGWRGRLDHELESVAAIVGAVTLGAGWVHVPRSVTAHRFPGAVYRPLAGGEGTPWDVYALTRRGEAEPGAADPLAAAFLACLREARDETAAEMPMA